MSVDERRRLALHRAAASTWGEEVADTLAELVGPSGDEVATRADVDRVDRRLVALDQRVVALDQRVVALDHRIDGLEQRIDAMDRRMDERLAAAEERLEARLEAMEQRLSATFERRIADAVSMQTRTLVFSQLGALVVIAALAFGLR